MCNAIERSKEAQSGGKTIRGAARTLSRVFDSRNVSHNSVQRIVYTGPSSMLVGSPPTAEVPRTLLGTDENLMTGDFA